MLVHVERLLGAGCLSAGGAGRRTRRGHWLRTRAGLLPSTDARLTCPRRVRPPALVHVARPQATSLVAPVLRSGVRARTSSAGGSRSGRLAEMGLTHPTTRDTAAATATSAAAQTPTVPQHVHRLLDEGLT
ncbi:hypothetical protein GCM10009756_27110 [Pseudokineococcus marinus]